MDELRWIHHLIMNKRARQREREIEREREREREIEREREEGERQRDRQRELDRQTDRHRETESDLITELPTYEISFFLFKKRKTQLELERWSRQKVKVREGGINSYLGWNNDR